MKNIAMNAVIVALIVANILTGVANYRAGKPKCLCDDCNRIRVSESRYCNRHEAFEMERILCLEVTSKSSN